MKKILGIILGMVFLLPVLAACSNTKPYASDCALVVGRGIGDTRQVKQVIHPGERSSVKGDDEQFVVPCNARNFLVTPDGAHGDRHNPAKGTTSKILDDKGSMIGPGTPVHSYLRMYWTLNQDDDVLAKEFFPLCRKYACASRNTDGSEDSQNFATAGWNGMLEENHSLIIDSAFLQAISQFDPNIWNEPEQWQDVADAMEPIFMEQMRDATGSSSDLFCGSWKPADPSDPGKGTGTCTPVRFTVTDVSAPDPVENSYNRSIEAQQESNNRIAELERKKTEVAAERDLANEREQLYNIPGYRTQLEHQYRMEEIQACGQAGLVVCPGSGAGGASVLVQR